MNKIKPILFNDDMVWAILEGRKTVTRRVAKKIPIETHWIEPVQPFSDIKFECHWGGNMPDVSGFKDGVAVVEPPYQPEDILYVRETWCKNANIEEYYYAANRKRGDSAPYGLKWRPSIHMPKEAARIWLKVTDVKVEKLQDITPEQLRREGMVINHLPKELKTQFNKLGAIFDIEEKEREFCNLWNSTLKKTDLSKYGWSTNPWVWVIEFEQCEKP